MIFRSFKSLKQGKYESICVRLNKVEDFMSVSQCNSNAANVTLYTEWNQFGNAKDIFENCVKIVNFLHIPTEVSSDFFPCKLINYFISIIFKMIEM